MTSNWPQYCIVCEPSQLQPVYAHKGGGSIIVTALAVLPVRVLADCADKGGGSTWSRATYWQEEREQPTWRMQDLDGIAS